MKITLKDGSVKEYDKAMTVYEIASGFKRRTCQEWHVPEKWMERLSI